MCANAKMIFSSLPLPLPPSGGESEEEMQDLAASMSPIYRNSRDFCIAKFAWGLEPRERDWRCLAAPSRSSISISADATRMPRSQRRAVSRAISCSRASLSPGGSGAAAEVSRSVFFRVVSDNRHSRARS